MTTIKLGVRIPKNYGLIFKDTPEMRNYFGQMMKLSQEYDCLECMGGLVAVSLVNDLKTMQIVARRLENVGLVRDVDFFVTGYLFGVLHKDGSGELPESYAYDESLHRLYLKSRSQ